VRLSITNCAMSTSERPGQLTPIPWDPAEMLTSLAERLRSDKTVVLMAGHWDLPARLDEGGTRRRPKDRCGFVSSADHVFSVSHWSGGSLTPPLEPASTPAATALPSGRRRA
jgi:hypothetical protein